MRFSLVGLIAVLFIPLPTANASPFDFGEEIEQRGGGGMGGGGLGSQGDRCASFAKANRCKPRFDSRIRSCVCT